MNDLENKLDYLEETKNLIREAIEEKGQVIVQTAPFRDYVNKIKNIETGTGIDTSDATATSNDLLNPKTAYVNNEKITGNIIPIYEQGEASLSSRTIDYDSINLSDININDNLAVSNSSTDLFIYNIDNNIIKEIKTINISELHDSYNINNFYDQTSKIAYLSEDNIIKIYVLASDLSTNTSIIGINYNIEEASYSIDHVFSTNYCYDGEIITIPNTTNQILLVSLYKMNNTLYIELSLYDFNTYKDIEIHKIDLVVTDNYSNYLNISYQFLTDYKIFCLDANTTVNQEYWGINDIIKFTNNYEVEKFILKKQGINHCNTILLNNLYYYMDYKESGNSGIYSIETSEKVYNFNYDNLGTLSDLHPCIFLGNKLYLINNDNVCQIFDINSENSRVDLVGSINTYTMINLFMKYNTNIIYIDKSNNMLNILELSEEGNIISLQRLGQTYQLLNKATATSEDILIKKSAYNNNGYIEGTMQDLSKTSISSVISSVFETDDNLIGNGKLANDGKVEAYSTGISAPFPKDKVIKAIDLTADKIVEGNTILGIAGTGVTGIDTEDADATADDIINPKTAYVKGKKITGNIIPTYSSEYTNTLEEHSLSLNDITINNIFCVLPDETYIIYVDLTEGFKINVCNKNSNITDTKDITDYNGTNSEIPIMIKCSNLLDSDNCYNLCMMTRQDKNIYTYIFKLNISNGLFSSNFNRSSGSYSYNYTSQNCCFANKAADIVIWFTNERGPGYIPLYRINKDCTLTKVSNVPNTTNFYWIGALEFSSDDKYLCYNNGHAQDYGCAMLVKLSSDYTSQTFLKSQYGTVWIMLDDVYLVEITNESAKLYRYDTASNKLNLTFIDNVPDTPFCTYGTDFNQVSILPNNYYAILRGNIIYIYKFDRESESVSLIKSIDNFGNANITSYNIQFTKNNIINISTPAFQKILYSLATGSNTLYNTINSTISNDNVLNGKIYFNDKGKQVGSMPNNGQLEFNSSIEDQIIPSGYTSGGTIKAYNIEESDVYKNCNLLADTIIGSSNPIQRLNYIETSGSQYIKTDISINNNMKIIFNYKPVKISNGQTLFGTISNNNIYVYASGFNAHSNCCGGSFFGRDVTVTESVKSEDVILTITNNKVTYKSETVDTYKDYVSNSNEGLLQIFNNSRYNEKGSIRLYSIEIDNNDSIVHNLYPAVNIMTGEIGLYDSISEKMYTNNGTGEFIKGGII